MKCQFCNTPDTKVVDTRLIDDGESIRRRRECPNCNARFTTYEKYANYTVMVVKKNNKREPFDRKKVRSGVARACSKRGISGDVIDRLVDSVEKHVYDMSQPEVKARTIGEIVLKHLKELDEVAYLRFASVYKEFNKRSSFIEEARLLDADK